MSPIPIFQVDAFTDRMFSGNPAAVCILDRAMPDEWMQSVGAEMNLAETAFIRALDRDFEIRWFTPAIEVALCGHATLAAAHSLWESGRAERASAVRFHSKSGVLTAEMRGDLIELDFPANPASAAQPPQGLIDALAVTPIFVGRSRFDYIVEVQDAAALRGIEPDFRRLASVDVRGTIVTCASDVPEYDFLSRFFAPAAGVDEDPVTGSAHCCLGPFWQRRLDRSELTGFQCSRRGGIVRVRMLGDRVLLIGSAVTVLRGELLAG